MQDQVGAGLEGTLSRGIRSLGLRGTRYPGRAKTHVQPVATAAVINAMRVMI